MVAHFFFGGGGGGGVGGGGWGENKEHYGLCEYGLLNAGYILVKKKRSGIRVNFLKLFKTLTAHVFYQGKRYTEAWVCHFLCAEI